MRTGITGVAKTEILNDGGCYFAEQCARASRGLCAGLEIRTEELDKQLDFEAVNPNTRVTLGHPKEVLTRICENGLKSHQMITAFKEMFPESFVDDPEDIAALEATEEDRPSLFEFKIKEFKLYVGNGQLKALPTYIKK